MSNNERNEALNRLRVILVELGKTSHWLAEQLGKTEHTISRWCQNKTQPSVALMKEISTVLNVDVKELLNSTKQ